MQTRTRLIIGTICVIYIAIRLWRLDAACLWFDEIFSIHAAEHDWNSIWSFVAKDLIHPPLFYLILKIWVAIGGESVFWLRLLPVGFACLALFPFVRLVRELKLNTSVVLVSLFLLAINGALIKYTQTLRMYSMLMFLGLLSMWLFARYFKRGKSWVPLVIVNVLLIYTHYFGWLVLVCEVIAILWLQPIKWRRMLVMLGISIVAFLPWAIAVIQAATAGADLSQNIGWQTRPALRELITFTTDLIEPFYYQMSSAEPPSIYFISTPMILVCTTAIGLFAMEWKREESKQEVYLLLLFFALPILVAFGMSWLLPHSVWGTRHLIIVIPVATILIAHSMMNSSSRAFRAIAAAAVVVIGVVGFVYDVRRDVPKQVWCAWNDVAADIESRSGPEPAKIYAFEDLAAYHLWFALRRSTILRVGVVKGIEGQPDDPAYFLPRGFMDVATSSIDQIAEKNVWIAFRSEKPVNEVGVIENFKRVGFHECSSFTRRYGSTTFFWTDLRKDQSLCRSTVGIER
jgi:4-amino-4-deoxy-L-arabinose transferase-like glycosyltransferase